MVSDYKQATVHWKQPVQINKMKADTFGDGLESFPLENTKGIEDGTACVYVTMGSGHALQRECSSPPLDSQSFKEPGTLSVTETLSSLPAHGTQPS